MNWKRWLLVLVLLALAAPVALYLGSLDWSRTHAAHVASLPLLTERDDEGEFRIAANGFEFRARVAGMQNSGDGVVLLHGFPETSIRWLPLIAELADAGYRVVAFDQRGYSPGARPGNVEDYQATLLAEDVIAVADAVGFGNFHLVGHDWGSAVGWVTVFNDADRIRSWTGLAIPHLGAFTDALVNDPDQRSRSSYFETFRKPMLVEFLFTINGQSRFKKMLTRAPEAQREEYLRMLAEPGALTAVLNWYRAMENEDAVASRELAIDVSTPTLFIWGNQDFVVARTSVEGQRPYLVGPYREIELEAGHSLLREKPEQVIPEILAHIGTYASESADQRVEKNSLE